MMKPKQYFPPSILTALTEMQKAMNQRLTTSETFDPFKSNEQAFALRPRQKSQGETRVHQEAPSVPDAGAEQHELPGTSSSPPPSEELPQKEPEPLENALKKTTLVEPSKMNLKSMGKLNAAELRRAVILSEIIGPPLSRRGR